MTVNGYLVVSREKATLTLYGAGRALFTASVGTGKLMMRALYGRQRYTRAGVQYADAPRPVLHT